jgi:phage terminase small subunit
VAVELEPQGHGGALKRSHAVPPDPDDAVPANDDALAFLLSVQNSLNVDIKLRVRAAIAAAQYQHTKRGDGGKKEELADKAKKAAGGKFGVRQGPPSLKVVGGR